ncbi:hypothetical protein ONS95_011380 [Cadophora gregata]|uniref:uncharacterized protein n=1 Tax=Cadophora gregata TaxID=51156 RepID=UPI0026DD3ADD|nr:uncharacterized protein ONS95_011380 [Cadophora gregata]KAK0119956.1 hypothetical protein ONS95_011380 [Cadophora gregata]KAK0120991.1 hypothetical protein ONS96_011182 [Cadophora gregata f. sp. sojae]
MSVVNHGQKVALQMDALTSLELKSFNTQTSIDISALLPSETNTPPPVVAPFPLLSLPLELLHQIVSNYYALLPHLTITQCNHHLPHHALTPLALSNPLLLAILPPSFYYAHATFVFSSPSLLQPFGNHFNRSNQVRKIKIWYGTLGPLGPGTAAREQSENDHGKGNGRQDWVFSFLEAFKGLEEVTFVIELGISKSFCERSQHMRVMEGWWGCVRDAVREGIGARPVGRGRKRIGNENGLTVKVECEGVKGCWAELIRG